MTAPPPRLSATRATLIALFCTFSEVFDVPVYWPILVVYFFVLFTLTMRRQIQCVLFIFALRGPRIMMLTCPSQTHDQVQVRPIRSWTQGTLRRTVDWRWVGRECVGLCRSV